MTQNKNSSFQNMVNCMKSNDMNNEACQELSEQLKQSSKLTMADIPKEPTFNPSEKGFAKKVSRGSGAISPDSFTKQKGNYGAFVSQTSSSGRIY
ncbi:MAG: hypothetical protein PQ612_09520 [Rickettsiales bacterium]|nr:hypothetical protein [Pseudomonadota bacterium]MDA0967420.1 hypothetical protein [Pseudomonadota bacterium]MDG4544212.1 hypothetical protein [Rickettsiales bacterium]MDG4546393.1 hypothetical protein [Rickettsiales bacterium]MDG4548536.1 hypothetical protein [Rickettsiales bacterium]